MSILMATIVALVISAGAVFVEFNMKLNPRSTQHYWLVALPVAGIAVQYWTPGQFGWSEGVFLAIMGALVMVAYGLPGSERNDRVARWVFRASLGWALAGVFIITSLDNIVGWLINATVSAGLLLLIVAVLVAAYFVWRWWNNRRQQGADASST